MSTVDVDALPPTRYLILEVLAARHRTGETWWTFPQYLRHHLDALEVAGLIHGMHGVEPKTLRARLTGAGRAAALMGGYVTPNDAASAKLDGVWQVYADAVQDPDMSKGWLLHRLQEALRGQEAA